MTTIGQLGEFKLIDRFAEKMRGELPEELIGIGDDCAVVAKDANTSWLYTADSLQEDVHFTRELIKPVDLGYKSLMVNLSDVAAMGGQALYCLLCLSLPEKTQLDWVDGFFEGFHQAARKHGVLILGGDTTRASSCISIGVTAIGEVAKDCCKLRSGVRPGDIICTTGPLGGSAAGFHCLYNGVEVSHLIKAHVRPEAHLHEGQWLGQQKAVHAMIDVSDGLYSDLERLSEASGCGFDVELSQLPITEGSSQELALFGGEDYCLLLAIAADRYEDLATQFDGTLRRVGLAHSGTTRYLMNGQPVVMENHSFKHF